MGRRIVMCNAYADLHMRNGDVVPMFLQGQELKAGERPEEHADFYLEMVEPLFTGQWERQDNGMKMYHGPCETVGDFSTDPQTGEKRQVFRIVRIADICYATLRFDITEEREALMGSLTGSWLRKWGANIAHRFFDDCVNPYPNCVAACGIEGNFRHLYNMREDSIKCDRCLNPPASERS